MKSRLLAIAINLIGFAVAVAVAVAAGRYFEARPSQIPNPDAHAGPPLLADLGVYEPTSPASYSGVQQFARLIRHRPQIAVYYSSWWEPFQAAFARAAHRNLATPMIQIEPRGISLAAIAAGQYDSYLSAYARAVRTFGQPVILSFGHEMNADWYGWGYRHTSPAVFVAAWRHIHDLFAAEGAAKVTWLWTVNVTGGPQVSTISRWWPGAAYVTWVGVDGHYFDRSIRFPQLFGATLSQVRRISRDPVLIAESGVAPDVAITRITDLFAGAQAHGLLGVVWFDVTGHNARIEGNRAAIATFEHAVSRYCEPADTGGSGNTAVAYVQGARR